MVAVETATLTRTQAATVKRRVDALNATLQRGSSSKHGDVRDIFSATAPGSPDKQVSNYRFLEKMKMGMLFHNTSKAFNVCINFNNASTLERSRTITRWRLA